jgi:hypothetical protein
MKKEMMTRKTMMRTINEGGGRVPPVHGYGWVKLGHVRLGCLGGQSFGCDKTGMVIVHKEAFAHEKG